MIAAYEIARTGANETRAVLRRRVVRRTFTDRDVRKAEDLTGAGVGMRMAASIALEKQRTGAAPPPPGVLP